MIRAIPQAFAWAVPDPLPAADAATIEPAAVALHALGRAERSPGDAVAVVGCGGVGLLVAQIARAAIGSLSSSERAAAGVAAAFECAGRAATAQLCLDAVPPGRRVVLVDLAAEDVALNPLRFVRAEPEVRGALIYDHPADFAATITLVAAGQLAPGGNTTPPRPLEDLAAVFAAMDRNQLPVKALIASAGRGQPQG